MAATVKLVTKDTRGKMNTKEIDSWALDQFKVANQIVSESTIEITEAMVMDKKPVYFHDGNILIKATFRARKGPAKKQPAEYDAFQEAIDEIENQK